MNHQYGSLNTDIEASFVQNPSSSKTAFIYAVKILTVVLLVGAVGVYLHGSQSHQLPPSESRNNDWQSTATTAQVIEATTSGNASQVLQSCAEGYTLVSNLMCLNATLELQDFSNATETCEASGGNLVSIHSAEQNSAVVEYLISVNDLYNITVKTAFWIGLYSENNGTEFFWTDGSTLDYSAPLDVELTLGRSCFATSSGKKWHDKYCKTLRPSICSVSPGASEVSTKVPTTETAAVTEVLTMAPTEEPTLGSTEAQAETAAGTEVLTMAPTEEPTSGSTEAQPETAAGTEVLTMAPTEEPTSGSTEAQAGGRTIWHCMSHKCWYDIGRLGVKHPYYFMANFLGCMKAAGTDPTKAEDCLANALQSVYDVGHTLAECAVCKHCVPMVPGLEEEPCHDSPKDSSSSDAQTGSGRWEDMVIENQNALTLYDSGAMVDFEDQETPGTRSASDSLNCLLDLCTYQVMQAFLSDDFSTSRSAMDCVLASGKDGVSAGKCLLDSGLVELDELRACGLSKHCVQSDVVETFEALEEGQEEQSTTSSWSSSSFGTVSGGVDFATSTPTTANNPWWCLLWWCPW